MARQIKGKNGGTLIVPDKGESLNPNGRPRKLVSHINNELKEQGYEQVTKTHIIDAYQTLINLPLSKVAAIANKSILYKNEQNEVVYLHEGDNYPLLYRLVAKELLGRRGGEYLEKILDRAYGKPKNETEISGKDGQPINIIFNKSPGCEPIPD